MSELVEVTFVTMDFTDVSPKDDTLIFPKLIHVIAENVEVPHENLPDKLPPTRDIQHVIDLVPASQELVFLTCHTI